MEKEQPYTSASMFPQVAKQMMTAITNKDLTDQELGRINEMCRDLQGAISTERIRRQQQNKGMEK